MELHRFVFSLSLVVALGLGVPEASSAAMLDAPFGEMKPATGLAEAPAVCARDGTTELCAVRHDASIQVARLDLSSSSVVETLSLEIDGMPRTLWISDGFLYAGIEERGLPASIAKISTSGRLRHVDTLWLEGQVLKGVVIA